MHINKPLEGEFIFWVNDIAMHRFALFRRTNLPSLFQVKIHAGLLFFVQKKYQCND